MRAVRVGLPALVGLAVLFVGIQQVAGALGDSGTGAVAGVRGGLVPVAIGVGLLLVSLAIARRSRLGYVLGIGTSVLMVLGGIAVVVIEIPYIQGGGLGAAFGGGILVLAVIWTVAWAGHAASMRRARAEFAATSQPGDRPIFIILVALAVLTPAAYVGLGALEGQRMDTADAAHARAAALVAGTSLAVSVVDVTLGPTPLAGATASVEHLVVELSVLSAEEYALAAYPTLCLTDLATAQDPEYKFDVFCWGGPGQAVGLEAAVPDLAVVAGTDTLRVDLSRGESPCSFGPGPWRAELILAPKVDGAGAVDGAPGTFSVSADFDIDAGGTPLPSRAEGAPSDCIASSISP